MTQSVARVRQHSNPYQIFILVLTVLSLVIMALLLLPLSPATHETLRFYDNVICGIFLLDFTLSLLGSHPRREYFVRGRGWIDLLGSIPSFGAIPALGLFRLFRLFRLARIARLLQGQKKKELIEDILHNRSQYATFITVTLALLVLVSSSLFVLQFESRSPDANITTGGDALWWSAVTITTVGYGDFFPVTTLGRVTGLFVMIAGVGIIGALASILASLLVSPAPAKESEHAVVEIEASEAPTGLARQTTDAALPDPHGIDSDLARTRAELAQTREEMAELRRLMAGFSVPGPRGGAAAPEN
jgi:voltage-gated potassium channel